MLHLIVTDILTALIIVIIVIMYAAGTLPFLGAGACVIGMGWTAVMRHMLHAQS